MFKKYFTLAFAQGKKSPRMKIPKTAPLVIPPALADNWNKFKTINRRNKYVIKFVISLDFRILNFDCLKLTNNIESGG